MVIPTRDRSRGYVFPFERLEVHRLALELMPVIRAVTDSFPRGYGDLKDHIHRSGRSIHLNIAEGSGRRRPGNKVSRYDTARASANECASGIAEALAAGIGDRKLLEEADARLRQIAAMLTGLINRWSPP
jgi:four helix bundle protein